MPNIKEDYAPWLEVDLQGHVLPSYPPICKDEKGKVTSVVLLTHLMGYYFNGAKRVRAVTEHTHDFMRRGIPFDVYYQEAYKPLDIPTKAIGLEMNICTDPEKPLDFSWLGQGQSFDAILEKLDVVVISAHKYFYDEHGNQVILKYRDREDYVETTVRAIREIRKIIGDAAAPGVVLGHPSRDAIKCRLPRHSDQQYFSDQELERIAAALYEARVFPELNLGEIADRLTDMDADGKSILGFYVDWGLKRGIDPFIGVGIDAHNFEDLDQRNPVRITHPENIESAMIWVPERFRKKEDATQSKLPS